MGEEGGDEWTKQLESYLCTPSKTDTDKPGPPPCCAGALAYKESGEIFAAAPFKDDAGWAICFADKETRPVLKDDGESTENIEITEGTQLAALIKNVESGVIPPAPRGGLWLGGVKYIVTATEEVEGEGDDKHYVIIARGSGDEKLKKRGVIIGTSAQLCTLGFYDEEEVQTASGARHVVQEFAKWCCELGQ